MKPYLFIAAGFFLSLLTACEEIGPAIDFTGKQVYDTSYTESPQAAVPRTVLVEEFTGVQCTNCPDAASLLKSYEASHPGRIIVAGIHAGSLTAPINDGIVSRYDFRIPDGLTLMNSYFGELPPKPAAGFDRVPIDGVIFDVNRSAWNEYMDNRAAVPSPVKIEMESDYDSEKKEAFLRVKVSYTAKVEANQSLSVWILEDKIIDAQLFPAHKDQNYEHNHVLRQFLTPVMGASFLDAVATKMPGQVYERTFIYPVSDAWNTDNLRVIAFVHNNEPGDKAVAQVAEVHLKD